MADIKMEGVGKDGGEEEEKDQGGEEQDKDKDKDTDQNPICRPNSSSSGKSPLRLSSTLTRGLSRLEGGGGGKAGFASSSGTEIRTSVTELMHGFVLSIVFTVVIGGLLYGNYLLYKDYLDVFLWSSICAEALKTRKRRLSRQIRKVIDIRMPSGMPSDDTFADDMSDYTPAASPTRRALTRAGGEEDEKQGHQDHDHAAADVDHQHYTSYSNSHTKSHLARCMQTIKWSLLGFAPIWLLLILILCIVSIVLGTSFLEAVTASGTILAILYLFRGTLASVVYLCCYSKRNGASGDWGASSDLFLSFGLLITMIAVVVMLIGLACMDIVQLVSSLYASASSRMDQISSEEIATKTGSLLMDGIDSGYSYADSNYGNQTWWPVAEVTYKAVKNGWKIEEINEVVFDKIETVYGNETWFGYFNATVGDLSAAVEDVRKVWHTETNVYQLADFSKLKDHAMTIYSRVQGLSTGEIQSVVGKYLKSSLSGGVSLVKVFGGTFISSWLTIWNLLSEGAGQLVWFVLFFTHINLYIRASVNPLDRLISLLFPTRTRERNRQLSKKFRINFEGVVWVPLEAACLNCAFSIIAFHLLGFPCVYLAAFTTFCISIVYCGDSVYLFHLPWIAVTLIGSAGLDDRFEFATVCLQCIMLFSLHFFGYGLIWDAVMSRTEMKATGIFKDLSLGLGILVFGFRGIVLGPLLTNMLSLVISEASGDV